MDALSDSIKTSCHQAFDDFEKDPTASRVALKSIANTLLLKSEARQVFVDLNYASKAADRLRINEETREDELICSRILFLLTYDTTLNFDSLFDDHSLAQSIHDNIAFHASKYSGQNPRDEDLDKNDNTSADCLRPNDNRALTETLKLLFNVTQFYPSRIPAFTKTIPHILTILLRISLDTPALQNPVTSLINALLNLDLPGSPSTDNPTTSTPLFPASNPTLHTARLISILSTSLLSPPSPYPETSLTPLLTLLRRIRSIAPLPVQKPMQTALLPSITERDHPLGKSHTLPSHLLRLSTSPSSPHLTDAILSLLFELSDQDPTTFIRNIGYGYAAGYLMTHSPALLSANAAVNIDDVTRVEGQEVNPITGQRRDREPVVDEAEAAMSEEEKEREAERLFVLFERLRATGVVDVGNPVERAVREGRFEEVE